jgi:hypothetical protein
LALAVLMLVAVPTAWANDRVRIQDPEKSGPVVLVGEIGNFLGDTLTIRLKASGATSVPADQILEIETYYTPLHREGLELYEQGETEKAQTAFEGALKEENRQWVKREILAWLVRCGWRRNDLLTAGHRFREIILSDPETRHWSIAPLIWAPTPIGAPLQDQARRWQVDELPAARLLGASILLLDPIYGESARSTMDDLARTPKGPIAPVARTQLWRVRLGNKALSESELESWRRQIDHLPVSLRGGPQFLLAKGYATRNADRDAAAEWMWLPLVYNEIEPLASRAHLEAALATGRAAGEEEYRRMLQGLIEQFPHSSEAAEAKRLLQEGRSEKQ